MRGPACLALALVAPLVGAPAARAQGTSLVEVVQPVASEALRSATPTFIVVARGLGVPASSVSLELQVATTAGFEPQNLVFADTAAGDSADFVPVRPLPSGVPLFWRGIARLDGAVTATSPAVGPRTSATWLTLVEPDAPNGIVLNTRRPRFVWSSATVTTPPGPWRYDIEVSGVATGERIVATLLADTTFVPPRDLEANTSYRWSVTAYLPATGDTIRRASIGSFVITTPDQPLATLLYQNFPNPFPTARAAATCIWFDIAVAAGVRLEILTLRGERVRNLYPEPGDPLIMRPGRYGRADVGSNTGCDPRFAWDGRSDAGVTVSAGVYLLRLQAGERRESRRIVFRGG